MTELIEHTCGVCGQVYGIERGTYFHLKTSGQTFYCTNGHPRVFTKTPVEDENDRIRLERDRLRQSVAELEDARALAERRASAARGQVTRLKNRAANGVCPCCSRSFANLHRHMQTKHAGFLAEEVQGEHGTTIQ